MSSGDRGEVVNLTYATHIDVSGRHVLMLKDVCHTGVTENYLITHLSQQQPASIEVVALVDRPHLRSVNLPAKYAVYRDETDGYLVGYGLGLEWGKYTNRPDLCVDRSSVNRSGRPRPVSRGTSLDDAGFPEVPHSLRARGGEAARA